MLDLQLSNLICKGLQVTVGFLFDSIFVMQWCMDKKFYLYCSKCGRLLMMDKTLALLLPPVHRPYFLTSSVKGQSSDLTKAYHIGCSSEEIWYIFCQFVRSYFNYFVAERFPSCWGSILQTNWQYSFPFELLLAIFHVLLKVLIYWIWLDYCYPLPSSLLFHNIMSLKT